MARYKRRPTEFQETSYWQSYSDMMAGVLLVFILIICGTLFVLMQVKNSYDASELELQERESELEQAILENLGYLDLTEEQQTTISEQETTISEQESELEDQQLALSEALAQLAEQQAALEDSQALLLLQQAALDAQEDQIALQAEALENQQLQLEQIIGVKRDLIAALSDAFANSSMSISIDEDTGAIMLDSSIIFGYDDSELSDSGKEMLDEFLPEYFSIVLSDEYIDYIAEIIVEGHTDTAGSYAYNLDLSQARAGAVAKYFLDDDQELFDDEMLGYVRTIVSASGRSWSNPIYAADGTVDEEASRRVEIKFRLSDDEMINEMLDVLDEYDPDSLGSAGEPTATPAPPAR